MEQHVVAPAPCDGHFERGLVPQRLLRRHAALHARQRRFDREGHQNPPLRFARSRRPGRRERIVPQAVEIAPPAAHERRTRVFGQRSRGIDLGGQRVLIRSPAGFHGVSAAEVRQPNSAAASKRCFIEKLVCSFHKDREIPATAKSPPSIPRPQFPSARAHRFQKKRTGTLSFQDAASQNDRVFRIRHKNALHSYSTY